MDKATDDGITTAQVIAGLEKFKSYMIHVEEYKPESLQIFDKAVSQLAAVTAENIKLKESHRLARKHLDMWKRICCERDEIIAAVTAERDRCVAALIRIATDAAVGDDAHDPKDRPMNIAAQALTPKEPTWPSQPKRN